MDTIALWTIDADPAPSPPFETLSQDITVDVAIIGGGITGITTAQRLTAAGLSVAVLESLSVGGGTTGSATGNLYAMVDRYLHTLVAKHGAETTALVVRARTAAVELVAQLVADKQLDCGFVRAPFYLISESEEHDATIADEHEAARSAGLDCRLDDGLSAPFFPARRVLSVERQAQINPLRYTHFLAKAIVSDDCRVFEHTKVTAFDEADGVCTVHTTGGTVTAKHVVVATHSPKGVMFVQTLLAPYREYGVAATLEDGAAYPPPGIYWTLTPEQNVSVRSYHDAHGQDHVIAVGEPHKTGQEGDNRPHVARLEAFLRERFSVKAITHRWGAQNYRPADLLPYIGRRDDDSNVFIATGFAADGLVGGTLAAMLISDEIQGIPNVWAKTFAFTRHSPLKAAGAFIMENANVALQYLKDLPGQGDVKHLSQVPLGEGRVVSIDGHRCAAYRDPSGRLEVVSAVCTHLAGIVNFNHLEKSWDCPCHGSRFRTDGTVIEGPAIADLKPLAADRLAHALEEEDQRSST